MSFSDARALTHKAPDLSTAENQILCLCLGDPRPGIARFDRVPSEEFGRSRMSRPEGLDRQ